MKRGKIKHICHFDHISLKEIWQLVLYAFIKCQRSQMCWVISKRSPHPWVPRVLGHFRWLSLVLMNSWCSCHVVPPSLKDAASGENWFITTSRRNQTTLSFVSTHFSGVALLHFRVFFLWSNQHYPRCCWCAPFTLCRHISFPSHFSFISLCTAWGHKSSEMRGSIEIICDFLLRGRMCNLAVLLTNLIGLRQGIF